MKQRFYELRRLEKTENRIAIDIARHVQARQHLGTSVVVCEKPHALMSAVRKQWLRLVRAVQRQRASTLNAEEILRHTRAIMLMQNMQFVNKTPAEEPEATVYFMTPEQARTLPANCYSLYLSVPMSEVPVGQLAPEGLVVSYVEPGYTIRRLQPKERLEQQVLEEWYQLASFLRRRDIQPEELSLQDVARRKNLDAALDALMADPAAFLELAFTLQRSLDLAQPLSTIPNELQLSFEAVGRLAYRVNTLSPDKSMPHFATAFADNDNYFLRDSNAGDDESLLLCEISLYRRATIKA